MRYIAVGIMALVLAACSHSKEATKDAAQEQAGALAGSTLGAIVDPSGRRSAPSAALGHFRGAVAGLAAAPPPPPPRRAGDIDTERYDDVDPNPVKQTAKQPVSTFAAEVDTASYANVRRYLTDGTAPPRDAVRPEELLNYFDYDYPLASSADAPFQPSLALVPSPWAKHKVLLHIGLRGYDVPRTERPPVNLTFLIDVSGSMQPENKLPLVKKALRLLVDQLTEKDSVALVVYAGAAGEVLAPTSGADKAKILSAIENLSAGGSTAGGEGLALAYRLAESRFDADALNRVMIATDGDFNVGVVDDERLEDFVAKKRETGIFLSVIGVGAGNYNDALMQTLAQNGNGTANYLDTLNEAQKVFNNELAGALFPIAKDVKIQVEFNPAKVAEWRLIGYETRALQEEDFKNDRVDAGEIGAGSSVTAIYELTPVGSSAVLIDPPRYGAPAPASSAAVAEWAFVKIRYKKPKEDDSRLIETPVLDGAAFARLEAASEATRFATAVAGYAQLLRGDPYLDPDFGFDAVIALANGAKGADPYGLRAEFVQLARLAKNVQPLPEPQRPAAPEGQPPLQPGPRPIAPRPLPHGAPVPVPGNPAQQGG